MIVPRDAIFAVTHREESGPVGPYIPTLGYATSASDMYRIAKIVETGHKGWNSCFTDVATCNALARLVEGEIRSADDLQDAEVALQILMWHDRVDVLVPGFKCDSNGLVAYARADHPRSQLAFDLFEPCVPYDQIFAVERAKVEGNILIESNLPGSTIVGKKLEVVKKGYLEMSPMQAATLAAVPRQMSVPAYFTDRAIEAFTGKRGFFGEFYASLAVDWGKAMAHVPEVEAAVQLPPLLAIILTRAGSRATIPKAIAELRAELAPVRIEMLGLSEVVQGALRQKDVEAKCREVKESFAAALPASRYPSKSFLFPLVKLIKAAKSPLDEVIKVLNPKYSPEDPRVIADRTVTGRTFARLLNTDSMHSMATHFFTASEIRNLERSSVGRSLAE